MNTSAPQQTPVPTTVALDMGGTAIKAAALQGRKILFQKQYPTNAQDGPDAAEEAIVGAAKDMVALAGADQVSAIGLVTPGVVDLKNAIVVEANNLGWKMRPIAQTVADRTGIPVAFGHDVRAAGMAEAKWGAAKDVSDFVFLPIGTGVASATIHNGNNLVPTPLSGEVGHGGYSEGELCVCGLRGCTETVASAAAIARRYRKATGLSSKEIPGSSAVLERMKAGEPIATEIWNSAIQRLAELLSRMVQILAPDVILIGGGLSNAGEYLMDPLTEQVQSLLSFHHMPQIRRAALGSSAGMWGAALLAQEGKLVHPSKDATNNRK